jgi:hypothetical protein
VLINEKTLLIQFQDKKLTQIIPRSTKDVKVDGRAVTAKHKHTRQLEHKRLHYGIDQIATNKI